MFAEKLVRELIREMCLAARGVARELAVADRAAKDQAACS